MCDTDASLQATQRSLLYSLLLAWVQLHMGRFVMSVS